jgi:hypothetical protein
MNGWTFSRAGHPVTKQKSGGFFSDWFLLCHRSISDNHSRTTAARAADFLNAKAWRSSSRTKKGASSLPPPRDTFRLLSKTEFPIKLVIGMPFRTIPGTDSTYALIAFDETGRERNDPDGLNGRMIDRLLDSARQKCPTNIFFFSHGWMGDVPAAVDQYNRWIKAILDLPSDLQRLAAKTRGFDPMYIGLHWPSLPWGDDELGATGVEFGEGERATPLPELRKRYLERLGDTLEIRDALDVILEEARVNAAATELPEHVIDAYNDLNGALDLGSDGEGAAPGDDREPFDPEKSFQIAQAESQAAGFGGFDWGGILSPLRQLSFWRMKKRARTVGENGMHDFIAQLQNAYADTKFHLMGHSFGCIVVSSILGGRGGNSPLPRPIDSVVLAQGALSIWSYCANIPKASGKPGYFHKIVPNGAVRGPVVTTQSRHDSAVGTFYPIAAGVARQVDFPAGPLPVEDLPMYGAIGTFGICGLSGGVEYMPMKRETEDYNFRTKTIYNLESSDFIRKGGGASGAHCDIDGPQVAHAIWQAALA